MRKQNHLLFSVAALSAGLCFSGSSALAASINADSFYAGPIPATAGSGLNATYYGQVYNGGDNSADDTLVGMTTPAATFTSTGIDYPAGVSGSNYGDNNSLSSFLGVDAASLNPSSVGTNQLSNQLITFKGYIALQAGTTNFQYGVDDGGYVNIGGIGASSTSQVIDNDGNHSFGFTSGSVTVTTAGLYPIYIDYHESGGNTGVTFQYNDGTVVPASVLYQVPEPSSCVLVGFGGLGVLSRRRRV